MPSQPRNRQLHVQLALATALQACSLGALGNPVAQWYKALEVYRIAEERNNPLGYVFAAQLLPRADTVLPSGAAGMGTSYQQVLVETLIFQYDENVAQRIGAVLDVKDENPSSGGGPRTSTVQFQFGSTIAESLPRFFYQLSDTEKRASLLARLAVSDSDGFVRVLAEPRLVLQSGESASVTLNTNKHVLIPGVNTPGTIERIEAGITLKLVPTVLGNGKVRIALELSQSDFVNTSETNIVATSVQNKVVTSIVAQDGEMVSIGGIHSRRDSRSGSGLPGVRDIPGADHLFGLRGADTSKSRIEFMIRPNVERAAQRLRTIRENVERTNELLQRDLDRDSRTGQVPDAR